MIDVAFFFWILVVFPFGSDLFNKAEADWGIVMISMCGKIYHMRKYFGTYIESIGGKENLEGYLISYLPYF